MTPSYFSAHDTHTRSTFDASARRRFHELLCSHLNISHFFMLKVQEKLDVFVRLYYMFAFPSKNIQGFFAVRDGSEASSKV